MWNWIKGKMNTSTVNVRWNFEELPIKPLVFTDDERRLFDLLPADEQVEFARRYFSLKGVGLLTTDTPLGSNNNPCIEFPSITRLANANA